MRDDVQEILNFFPIESVDFNAGSGDQYLQDLSKVIEDNCQKGNYQVAFFYTHLLFMSYVYYSINKAYRISPIRIKDIFYPINPYHGEKKPDLDSNNNYEFSTLPEKEVFKIFNVLGLDEGFLRDIPNYVKKRDNYAHATGKGNLSETALSDEIKGIINNIKVIEALFKSHAKNEYKVFLLENYHLKFKGVCSALEDFIYEKQLSIADLKFMCNIGISGFRNENEEIKINYRHIKNLHCAFYSYCIDNFNFNSNECYDEWTKTDFYLYYRYQDDADSYIEDVLNIRKYNCVKDGGVFPLYVCPNCDEEQLVSIEGKGIYKCFHCGYQCEERELTRCCECGEFFETEDEIICPDCIKRKMEED